MTLSFPSWNTSLPLPHLPPRRPQRQAPGIASHARQRPSPSCASPCAHGHRPFPLGCRPPQLSQVVPQDLELTAENSWNRHDSPTPITCWNYFWIWRIRKLPANVHLMYFTANKWNGHVYPVEPRVINIPKLPCMGPRSSPSVLTGSESFRILPQGGCFAPEPAWPPCVSVWSPACLEQRPVRSFQGQHILPCTPHRSRAEAAPRSLQPGSGFPAEKWKPSFHTDSLSRKLRTWEGVTFRGPKSV